MGWWCPDVPILNIYKERHTGQANDIHGPVRETCVRSTRTKESVIPDYLYISTLRVKGTRSLM